MNKSLIRLKGVRNEGLDLIGALAIMKGKCFLQIICGNAFLIDIDNAENAGYDTASEMNLFASISIKFDGEVLIRVQ